MRVMREGGKLFHCDIAHGRKRVSFRVVADKWIKLSKCLCLVLRSRRGT